MAPTNYPGKPVQASPIINLASKMDSRTNNEYLNVDPNATSFTFVTLENADLFNTKALSVRLGTQVLGSGIINATSGIYTLFDNTSGILKSELTQTYSGITNNLPYLASYLLITGNNQNILGGTITFNGQELSQPPLSWANETCNFNVNLYYQGGTYGQNSGYFKTFTDNIARSIGLGGNYNTPNPALAFVPISVANQVSFLTNSYAPSGNLWISPTQSLSYYFNAPYPLSPSGAYLLEYIFSAPEQRKFNILTSYSKTNDFSPLTSLALITGNNLISVKNNGNLKEWMYQDIYSYNAPSYILKDYPVADNALNCQIVSSDPTINYIEIDNLPSNYSPLATPPPIPTNTVEFGQTITLPSGTYTINGGYFYANTFSGLSTNSTSPSIYTTSKSQVSPLNYNAGYFCNFSSIVSSNGSSSSYVITQRDILASYSGNVTFTNPLSQTIGVGDNGYGGGMQKIYALFDNPVTIINTGVLTQYLLSFGFYDMFGGGEMTDFMWSTAIPVNGANYFQSPFFTALSTIQQEANQQLVTNSSNDGQNFNAAGPWGNGTLTCGLISIPSGNAITSIYNYEVEDNRSQRVIITQQDKLLEAPLYNFNFTPLLTGAQINNEYKWTHTTYQNELISHQYSQTSGYVWDQIYSNPSGNSMQLHGLRPQVTLSQGNASGFHYYSGAFGHGAVSGSYISVILATELATGGLRASNPYTFQISGVISGLIQLSGIDIFNPSGVPGVSTQYSFNVLPQATYVFVTQPQPVQPGSLYYLAQLQASSGNLIPNPLPNQNTWNRGGVGSGVYIADFSPSTLSQQVPQVIDYNQYYLTDQVDVPMFKKVGVYKDYVIGVGDPNNPSRLWYGQQFTSDIFGTDGQYDGYVDINLGDGSPITAFEVYRDYLIIFKYNSTFRLSYTGDPTSPFYITQISNTIGCLGFFSTVTTDYGIFGLSQFGAFLASYIGVESISDEIYNFYQTLDKTNLTFAVAIHDRARQQVYWSINNSNSSSSNNIALCYYYPEKAWNVRQGPVWNAVGIIRDADNFNLLYIGDNLGQLSQISVNTDGQDELFLDIEGNTLTKNISLVAETPWLNLGNSMNLKQLRNIRINCASSAQKLRIDVYFDQNNTKKYTRYLNMNAPVINRLVSLAQACRTVKFVFTSVGTPDIIEINSLQITYQNLNGRNQN